MVTYYCISLEEALRRAKAAGRKPGCYYGGIILPSGRRGFAVYKEGKAFEQYTASEFKADVSREKDAGGCDQKAGRHDAPGGEHRQAGRPHRHDSVRNYHPLD